MASRTRTAPHPPETAGHPMTLDDLACVDCLVAASEELNATLDLDEVLARVAERVRRDVGYDTFGVLLLDPLGQELSFRLAVGYRSEIAQQWRFGLGQGIVGTVAATGEAVVLADVRDDPRYISADADTRAELAIPLRVKDRIVGVLDLGSRQPGYFGESHRRYLTLLAGLLANAVENARLYESLREQTRTLSLLHEVSRELSSILDPDELLERVASLVKRLVSFDLFSVLLWNEESQTLDHRFALRLDRRMCIKDRFRLGYGITGTAAALRQAVRVPNVHLDARYVRCHQEVDVRSELAVPVLFKDRLLGVIDVESTHYDAFSPRHEQMLSILASSVAIAFENARLYQQLRQDEQRLEDDLDTAREIQKGLLPERAPQVSGLDIGFAWEPARQLGGDFYDFLPYGDGRLAVVVGDVAGKATPAALYGALAVGIVRSKVMEQQRPPAELLRELNAPLRQPRLANRFVALACAVFDPVARTLTVASSAFPRPWLVRGGRAEEIPVAGVPLGILPSVHYEQVVLELQEGDLVVFCSDGLHEFEIGEDEEFGLARLRLLIEELAVLPAQRMASELIRRTGTEAGNAGPADDRTAVVLAVGPPPVPPKP